MQTTTTTTTKQSVSNHSLPTLDCHAAAADNTGQRTHEELGGGGVEKHLVL